MPVAVIMAGQEVLDVLALADGTTPYDVTVLCNPETHEWSRATICMIDPENAILRAEWKTHGLYGNDIIIFVSSIQGDGDGGSNPLQVVFAVALMVIAIVAQQYWSTPLILGGSLTGGQLVAGGVMLAGGILASVIWSNPSGHQGAIDAEQASPTYSLNGSGNIARLGQTVPFHAGKMKIVPDVGATQWTQYIDNDMYLYQVFMCGLGKSAVHEMEYGGVVFWRDNNFIPSAYSSESGDQYVNAIYQTLTPVVEGGGAYGPYRAVSPTDVSMTMRVTLEFPDGLCSYSGGYYENNGDGGGGGWEWTPENATATFSIRSREIDSSGKALTGWKTWSPVSVTRATESSFSHLATRNEGRFGQFEVEVTNTSTIPDSVSAASETGSATEYTRKKVVLAHVSSFGVSIAVQIVEPGDMVTLFPDNVETSDNVASQELYAPNDDEQTYEWTGPFVVNSAGTTTDTVLFSFVMPAGIGKHDKKGNLENYTVKLQIQMRLIDDYGKALGSWVTVLSPSYTAATLTAQRNTKTVKVAAGRYEARVRRTSNKNTDNKAVERVQWDSMVAMLPGSLTYPQTAIAVKIKAGNMMSNEAARNFKILMTRKLPVYNRATKAWSGETTTRSFAAAICYVVKTWGGLTDNRIDLDTLWAIDAELQAQGWYFDAWIDGAYTVWQLVAEMCEAYRVIPRPEGTILSFVIDKAGRPVRHVFNPRNIVRGTFSRTFNTFTDGTPDDVNVSYLDQAVDYEQREVRAVLPQSESINISSRSYLGVCGRDHAHKIGLFKAACNRWRRLACEFETEGVGRLLNLGDVIAVDHPRFGDTFSGAVESWDERGLAILAGAAIPTAPKTPYISFNRPNGSVWGPCKVKSVSGELVTLDSADYALLKAQGFESPFSWFKDGADSMPTVFSLLSSRAHSRRYIITGISPSSLYRYTISCINDDDRVDAYWNIPTPPWGGRGNLPAGTSLSAPGSVSASLSGLTLRATWKSVVSATAYETATSADGVTWVHRGRTYINTLSLSVSSGDVWFRVAAIRDNEQSSWVVINAGVAVDSD